MHIFYTPDIKGKKYKLNAEESAHCVKVLRLKNDDTVNLVDGRGVLYKAQIEKAHVKGCSLKILESVHDYNKRSRYLHIAIAPTKKIDRFEWFLEKATEIGIDEITPILCDHSERRVIKPERLEKIMVTAMKQSQRAYLPILNPLTSLVELIEKVFLGERYVAYCEGEDKVKLPDFAASKSNTQVLIGPEGDFSENEIQLLQKFNYQLLSLGDSRLRTETAGIVACSAFNLNM